MYVSTFMQFNSPSVPHNSKLPLAILSDYTSTLIPCTHSTTKAGKKKAAALPINTHLSLSFYHFHFQNQTPVGRSRSRSSFFGGENLIVDFEEIDVKISSTRVYIANMPPRRYAIGRADEAAHPDTMRAALAEFVSTLIFVFAGEGSILALDKIYKATTTSPSDLVVIALAHALALFAAVASSINTSGGHINPAVTFGALLGGRISVVRAIYYWIAQLLGAIVAALLLRFATNGMRPVGFYVASGVGEGHGLVLEIVMTFGLVYTVYATVIDPKRGSLGIVGPLAIGFIVGANILVGGPFDGASMNPARAFGPALVGWRWKNHWIYWVGPFVGAGLAAVIYEYVVIPTEPPIHTHQPLAPEDY